MTKTIKATKALTPKQLHQKATLLWKKLHANTEKLLSVAEVQGNLVKDLENALVELGNAVGSAPALAPVKATRNGHAEAEAEEAGDGEDPEE